jgi:PleD family two-component response regulator
MTVEALLDAADQRLHVAKNRGRNVVVTVAA